MHFGVHHKQMTGRERDRAIANERGGHTKGRAVMSWMAEQATLDDTGRVGSEPSVPHVPLIAQAARSEWEVQRRTISAKVPASRGRTGNTMIMSEHIPSAGAAAAGASLEVAPSSREFTM